MKAMILAAGTGSRLLPLTERRAKPTLPLANRPLISYTLRLLASASVEQAVINLHHGSESVVQTLGDCYEGIALHYSHEPELRGTAGALLPMAEFFDEPFLLVYGDNLLDVDLTSIVAFHREREAIATIGLYHAADPTRVGMVGTDEDDRVIWFKEKPAIEELEATRYPARIAANAGIYVLEPEILRHIPATGAPDFGHDIFPALLRGGAEIAAIRARGYVQDTGTFEGYRRAHADLLQGWLPSMWRPEEGRLWEWEPGIFVHERARVACDARLEPPVLIGEGAEVRARACLGPNVCLGARVLVREAADLMGTIVWDGARIGERVWARHSIVAQDCIVDDGVQLLDAALPDGAVLPAGDRRTSDARTLRAEANQ